MVGNTASKYKLQVAGYSGTAGDSIGYRSGGGNLNGMAFTTYDRDNDLHGGGTNSTSYRLRATAELLETVLVVATASMECHLPS